MRPKNEHTCSKLKQDPPPPPHPSPNKKINTVHGVHHQFLHCSCYCMKTTIHNVNSSQQIHWQQQWWASCTWKQHPSASESHCCRSQKKSSSSASPWYLLQLQKQKSSRFQFQWTFSPTDGILGFGTADKLCQAWSLCSLNVAPQNSHTVGPADLKMLWPSQAAKLTIFSTCFSFEQSMLLMKVAVLTLQATQYLRLWCLCFNVWSIYLFTHQC